jgi:Rieske Fe-S protein
MSQRKTSRRNFLNFLLGGGLVTTLGAILYPVLDFIKPPPSGEANVSQMKLPFTRSEIAADPAMSRTFKFGRTLGIIVMSESGELSALAATCTHLDCTVQHRPDLGIVWCACHNGRYDLNGGNISGPPPRPLEKYVINEVGDDIFVSREDS